eukprot:gene9602-10617_t
MTVFCCLLVSILYLCSFRVLRSYYVYPSVKRLPQQSLSYSVAKIDLPIAREFVTITTPSPTPGEVVDELRVLQFNMLADGLSGLREDLGAFSRAKQRQMAWFERKHKLLYEILQYSPDIITLQECDHYYDFFLPELSSRGYDGVFAPKPASACLEVSDNSDGCVVFYKKRKLALASTETMTYALAKAEVMETGSKTSNVDTVLRPQNQVAIVLVFHLLAGKEGKPPAPPIILATTHLKASKNAQGEKMRHLEALQLLKAVERTSSMVGNSAAVLLTGDFNACPTKRSSLGFDCSVIASMQTHDLQLRSVMNDDLREELTRTDTFASNHQAHSKDEDLTSCSCPCCLPNEDPTWTTWKARRKGSAEQVVKHCIDYIFYAPPSLHRQVGIRAKAVLRGFREDEVDSALFPNDRYPSDHIAIAADLQIIRGASRANENSATSPAS